MAKRFVFIASAALLASMFSSCATESSQTSAPASVSSQTSAPASVSSQTSAPASVSSQTSAPASVSSQTSAPVAVSSVTEITTPKKVVKDYTVGEEEIMYISGGRLTVEKGVEFAVTGGLEISDDGVLCVCGDVDITGDVVLHSGSIVIMDGGSIDLSGKLEIDENSSVSGDGVLNVSESFDDIVCGGSVTANIGAPEPVKRDGVTYVGDILLVNKKYDLPESYGNGINSDAYSAFLRMKEESGFDMTIVSGYRSYEKQESTFKFWCDRDGYEAAVMYSAKPGHSEHQTGLAIDVTSIETDYAETEEGRWLAENCHKYGFIIRYPENKTDITGYIYEPWHIRYLGESTARLVHDSGLCLEEFLGLV